MVITFLIWVFFVTDVNSDRITNLISLFFLSLNGTYKAMGCEKRNPKTPQFTDHCFTGEYPIDVTEILKLNR